MSFQLKVFISYARKDAGEFVAELATGLEVARIEPLVDLQAISAAEEWEPRIRSLIQQADTVIFVITPEAVKSKVFIWEIEESIARSKRLIPVQWLETPVADIPAQLSKLQIISFSGNRSFAKSLKVLVDALETDLQWVREHTRLGERAVEWEGKYARDSNALLVGKQLDDAEDWMDRRPANAPLPTAILLEFIAASQRLAAERDSAERRRLAEIEANQAERAQILARQSRRNRQGLIGLGALALLIVAIASLALRQKQTIDEASLRLDEQKRTIDEASVRLKEQRRKIDETSLRLTEQERTIDAASVQLSEQQLTIEKRSFQLKEQEKTIAKAGYRLKEQQQAIDEASLRLKGMVLKIADTDHLVRASERWYRIATDYKLSTAILSNDLGNGKIDQRTGSGFLVRGRMLNPAWGEELVLLAAAHVLPSGLSSSRPPQAEVAKLSAVFPALDIEKTVRFAEVAFHSKELDVVVLRLSGPPPKGAFPISQIGSPRDTLGGVAVLHWTAAEGFAIGFGHGLAPTDGAQRTGEQEPGRLLYTHVTGGGASGAPVFNADTADLVCLHLGGMPRAPRPWAFCRSITTIVEATSRGQ